MARWLTDVQYLEMHNEGKNGVSRHWNSKYYTKNLID